MKANARKQQFIKQGLWVGGLFLFLWVLLSSVQRKRSSGSVDFVVEINGEHNEKLLTDVDVRKIIKRRFGHVLNGIPIANLDVKEVERVLEADPFILNADVYVGARNKVKVLIDQREPLLRVIDKEGSQFYLDDNGTKLPLSPNYTARVLVANGHIPIYDETYLDTEHNILKDLFELSKVIVEDEFFDALIDQVYVASNKDFILIPKVGSQKIILGKTINLEAKLEKLKVFYAEAMPHVGWKKYKTINLKFRDQVVCKKN